MQWAGKFFLVPVNDFKGQLGAYRLEVQRSILFLDSILFRNLFFRSHFSENGCFWSSTPKPSVIKTEAFREIHSFEDPKETSIPFYQLPGYIPQIGLGVMLEFWRESFHISRIRVFLKIMGSVFGNLLFSKFGRFWRFRRTHPKNHADHDEILKKQQQRPIITRLNFYISSSLFFGRKARFWPRKRCS